VNNTDLFKDRVFYSHHKKTCSEKEVDFVKLILSKINKPIKSPSNIELISINDEYDLYRFEHQKKSFCLKVSLDPECNEIKKEFKNLKKINPMISPLLYESGEMKIGDDICYLLIAFENAESVYSFGNSIIMTEFESFCNSYKLFQNSKRITNSYKNYLINFFKNHDLNIFPKDSINMIKENSDFDKIYQFVESLKDDLKYLTDERLIKSNFICHGDLNTKNILYKNGLFKFINFGNCFSSHCFLDLADLFISMGASQKLEKELLDSFCSHLNINFEENKKLYVLCSNIAIRKKILSIIFDYLKEIYLFDSLRDDKIIYLNSQFLDNYQRFLTIEQFFQNKELFSKIITEPLLK
jgi:thiamine kinase-like enzyme